MLQSEASVSTRTRWENNTLHQLTLVQIHLRKKPPDHQMHQNSPGNELLRTAALRYFS